MVTAATRTPDTRRTWMPAHTYMLASACFLIPTGALGVLSDRVSLGGGTR